MRFWLSVNVYTDSGTNIDSGTDIDSGTNIDSRAKHSYSKSSSSELNFAHV